MRNERGRTKAEALRAYDDGVPSVLPDGNRWKHLVEEHRWGEHFEDDRTPGCPVCERESGLIVW